MSIKYENKQLIESKGVEKVFRKKLHLYLFKNEQDEVAKNILEFVMINFMLKLHYY